MHDAVALPFVAGFDQEALDCIARLDGVDRVEHVEHLAREPAGPDDGDALQLHNWSPGALSTSFSSTVSTTKLGSLRVS